MGLIYHASFFLFSSFIWQVPMWNYDVLGIILATGDKMANKTGKPPSQGAYHLVGETDTWLGGYNGISSSMREGQAGCCWKRFQAEGTARIEIQRSDSMAIPGNWKYQHRWSIKYHSSHMRAGLKALTASDFQVGPSLAFLTVMPSHSLEGTSCHQQSSEPCLCLYRN